MATTVEILHADGIANAGALVSAAASERVPVYIAAAFAEMESGGENVYGHDQGGTFYGKGAVTETNYHQFYNLVVVQGGKSNGVGPMQITWKPFHVQAASMGYKLWIPEDNFRFGFGLVRTYLDGRSDNTAIALAGKKYNGKAAYGAEVATLAAKWKIRLGGASTPRLSHPTEVLPRGPFAPPRGGTAWGLGDTGEQVRRIQRLVGTKADGIFGPLTHAAVKRWQASLRLAPDGLVGKVTWAVMAKL